MRIVIALGGNALLRPEEPLTASAQRNNVRKAAQAIAPIARQHQVVVTHGNGPQVGLLAACASTSAWPLDVLTAETQGMIGYVLEQELANRLPGREVVTLLTQVVVDPDDPAFTKPSKPIGPVYDASTMASLAKQHAWSTAPYGSGLRRTVPSPHPREILGIGLIRRMMDLGVTVICAGGGGIPVVRTKPGDLAGVEGVIDKDHTAALLAMRLRADALLILTDVPAVYTDWETTRQSAIRQATPTGLSRYRFAPGSMAPKIEASSAFVTATHGIAAIGALDQAEAVLAGAAGTRIGLDSPELVWYR